jgi:ribonuclease HIII
MTAKIIGTDEAGKGDYFGPLVVAAFCIQSEMVPALQELGVKDSKKLSDRRTDEIASELKKMGIHSLVSIGPQKYNQLYQQIKNLNRLLAWGHARAIENVLEQTESSEAISDKFGDEKYIENALLEKGKRIKLVQKVRAEEEPIVAAASILARAEFLSRLKKLSDEIGMELPKGASEQVDLAARKIVEAKGEEFLSQVAKLHFKNTQRVLCTKSS